jgi:hypothetical protein
LEASASFRLDRLVFAREELTVERLRAAASAEALQLERQALTALLGLFRSRELACRDSGSSSERPAALAKLLEQFAELDAITAGWFSAQAPDLGRAVWGFPEAVLGACSAPEPARASPATNPVASLTNSK